MSEGRPFRQSSPSPLREGVGKKRVPIPVDHQSTTAPIPTDP